MKVRWMLAALVAGSVNALALPPSAGLRLEGAGPYYTLELPLAWQVQAGTADLRGLQLRNALGEPLAWAWAWADATPAQASVTTGSVRFLKWMAPKAATPRPKGEADDTPRGWVLDLRNVKGDVIDVAVSLAGDANAVYPLAVEASDDLSRWRVVRPEVQLVSLQYQGQRLDDTVIELGGVRAAYLRLRTLGHGALPPLTAAEVTTVVQQAPAPELQWSEPIAPVSCEAQHCDYALPAVSLAAVELLPREANTVASVGWLGRSDAMQAASASREYVHRHRLHHPLHVLRDKRNPPLPAPDAGWQHVAQGRVWWLRLPQGETRSPAQHLDGAVHTQLRLQVAGGVAAFGAQPPQLRFAVRPRTLVLLARGSGPHRLGWGDPALAATPMSLGELMPARRGGDALPADRAVLQADVAVASPAALPASMPQPRSGGTRAWLWGALLAGVALMAAMAWSLLRGRH